VTRWLPGPQAESGTLEFDGGVGAV